MIKAARGYDLLVPISPNPSPNRNPSQLIIDSQNQLKPMIKFRRCSLL